ncbi:hypothetical protein BSY19_4713 (plasmid) [Bosea sp. RAC05]|nr:hypothetical protein BSY19_4713 [Bosea sp. RAC05]
MTPASAQTGFQPTPEDVVAAAAGHGHEMGLGDAEAFRDNLDSDTLNGIARDAMAGSDLDEQAEFAQAIIGDILIAKGIVAPANPSP